MKSIEYTGPKYDGPVKVSIEYVTPEIASKWLENNTRNRNILKSNTNKFSRDMSAGKWALNGETISFYEDGTLKDGQHRLSAVVKADTPVWMIVVRGIPIDVVIADRGRLRTVSSVMELAGYAYSQRNHTVVGTVKFMFDFFANNNNLTDQEVMDFIDKYSDYLETAFAVTRISRGSTGACSTCKASIVAAAFSALYYGVTENELIDFFTTVNTGFCDSKGKYSAIVFRNQSIDITRPGSKANVMLYRTALMALSDFIERRERKKSYTVLKMTGYEEKVRKEIFPAKGENNA